jgi:arginine exporter protein ArgO
VYLVIGFIIGFTAAIPLGPVNVFVISQTMRRDFFHGLIGGLTASILDTVYCLVAILGISQITTDFVRYGPYLKIVASVFLGVLGWRLFLHSRRDADPKPDKTTAKLSPRPVIGVFVLYISNPSLYAFWIAVAGMATSHGWVFEVGTTPILFAIACGLGGCIWYLILNHYVAKHHHQFSARTFRFILFAMSLILFVFAGYTFASIFIKLRI